MVRHLCVKQAAKIGVDFDTLTEDERFRHRHEKISTWLTLWLKRVRKNSGAPIRYIIVCEAHKSALPHYHALIHETDITKQVRKRTLQAAWPHGYTVFKLVSNDDTRSAAYVCKYLAKSNRARVRASVGYGTSSDEANVNDA